MSDFREKDNSDAFFLCTLSKSFDVLPVFPEDRKEGSVRVEASRVDEHLSH